MHPRSPLALSLLAALCLAALPAVADSPATSTAPAWSPPPTLESVKHARLERLDAPRLLAPWWVYQSPLKLAVELPASFHAGLSTGQTTCTVSVLRGDVPTSQPARVTLAPAPTPARRGSQPATASAPAAGPWRGELAWPVDPLTDGPLTFRVEIARAGQPPIVIEQRAEIVAERLARVPQPWRDELAVWLDDANANRPIWGNRPTWRNLDAIFSRLAGPAAQTQPPAADPFAGLRGFLLRSYANPQLGRRQPYTLYVPQALDLSQPAPLLILLHGSGGDYRNLVADEAAGQRFEQSPMLIANAGAFYHQEFRHLALNDVRGVLDDVCRKYNVDPDRVYLQGISLGGRGTLEAAALLPDTFAAICTQGTYGVQREWLDPVAITRRAAADPVALALSSRSDIRTWLPNLRNTPVELDIGWLDDTTPPGLGMLIAQVLRQSGNRAVRERGFPRDHNIALPEYDWATTRAWFLQQRRVRRPDVVRHRVSNLRFGRNAWVSVEALADYSRVGDVTAQFDQAAGAVRVDADNIARLTLDLPAGVRQVTVNQAAPVAVDQPGPLTLDLAAGRATPASQPAPGGVAKRPGLSGPLWDAFSSPVVYVYATGGDAETTAALKASAEANAEWDMAWGPDRLPVVADRDLTDVQRRTCTLVYFTRDAAPAASPATWAFLPPGLAPASQPAADWTPADPRLQKAIAAADVRVALRPSPFAPDRYVVHVALRGSRPINLHGLGWWDRGLHSDWVLARTVRRMGRRSEGLELLAAGVFDHAWQPAAFTTTDYRTADWLGPGAGGD